MTPDLFLCPRTGLPRKNLVSVPHDGVWHRCSRCEDSILLGELIEWTSTDAGLVVTHLVQEGTCSRRKERVISATVLFHLHGTHGFPVELAVIEAACVGFAADKVRAETKSRTKDRSMMLSAEERTEIVNLLRRGLNLQELEVRFSQIRELSKRFAGLRDRAEANAGVLCPSDYDVLVNGQPEDGEEK